MLVAGLLLQPGTATTPAPLRLPDECPRLLLTWHPGMPLPTTPPAEIGPSVVAAIWDSGIVLRTESIGRPHGPHVIGTVAAREHDELLRSVSGSAVWSQPSILAPDAPSLAVAWNRGSDVLRHSQSPAARTQRPTELETLRARLFGVQLQRVQNLAEPVAIDRWRCPAEGSRRR
jgi:hypothetical protein